MNTKPLAELLRPQSFEEMFGQKHLVGKNAPFRKMIENVSFSSFILWGPPGVGKTTIARIISKDPAIHFIRLSAITEGIPRLREIVKKERNIFTSEKKFAIFVDEIHHFNKKQQNAFLPHIENGTIVLIAATTENPSFYLIPPLISRCHILRFEPLKPEEIKKIVWRALKNKKRGLGNLNLKITSKALGYLTSLCSGDARIALNILEFCADKKEKTITKKEIAKKAKKVLFYDRAGDHHYDTISAFIKSIRGSNPDAALYYLTRMLESGEDPRFIARRLVILASEDIGNANPLALLVAVSGFQAVEFVGMPEAAINLAQVVTYLATSYKSNASYLALKKTENDIKNLPLYPVPLELRNASTELMKKFGYGKGYQYAHNFDKHFAPDMKFFPKEMGEKVYYKPTEQGAEKHIKERLTKWRKKKNYNKKT